MYPSTTKRAAGTTVSEGILTSQYKASISEEVPNVEKVLVEPWG